MERPVDAWVEEWKAGRQTVSLLPGMLINNLVKEWKQGQQRGRESKMNVCEKKQKPSRSSRPGVTAIRCANCDIPQPGTTTKTSFGVFVSGIWLPGFDSLFFDGPCLKMLRAYGDVDQWKSGKGVQQGTLKSPPLILFLACSVKVTFFFFLPPPNSLAMFPSGNDYSLRGSQDECYYARESTCSQCHHYFLMILEGHWKITPPEWLFWLRIILEHLPVTILAWRPKRGGGGGVI